MSLEFGNNAVKIAGERVPPNGVDEFTMVKCYQDSEIEVDVIYFGDDNATTETITLVAGDTFYGPMTRIVYDGAGLVVAYF